MVIMRTMDVFFAFPSVLLAVAISGSLGGGIVNQLITLTVMLIPPLCRVAETATAPGAQHGFRRRRARQRTLPPPPSCSRTCSST